MGAKVEGILGFPGKVRVSGELVEVLCKLELLGDK